MTPAFERLMKMSPSLQQFSWPGEDPEQTLRIMHRRLRTASSGERFMIQAALSLIPKGWLPKGVKAPHIHLSDVCSLDGGNTAALVAAIAQGADHLEVLGSW
jgi:hypothetical protein